VPNELPAHLKDAKHGSVGFWVKRYFLASRAAMDTVLRPYDLGSTQWYVLWQLANHGPTAQRDLVDALRVEKPTLSEVVGALVRKGFVEQRGDPSDGRQRLLDITPAGRKLWRELPDPIVLILETSFEGEDEEDLATVVRVLRTATSRLDQRLSEGEKK